MKNQSYKTILYTVYTELKSTIRTMQIITTFAYKTVIYALSISVPSAQKEKVIFFHINKDNMAFVSRL